MAIITRPSEFKPLELKLPTEKSTPVADLTMFSIFIYGKQGIGKTSFTAQFEDAIHLMFEPGAKTERIYQVHPNNWKEVIEYTRLIKEEKRYKNVIIDTVDLMFDMCCDHVCALNGVSILKDIGFGDGYNQAGNLFRKVLTELHMTKGLIMLAHDKQKMKSDDLEPDYTVPSTAKRGAETIAKWVDLAGHYYITKNGKRYLRIRTSPDREAKCRIKEQFLYTDGSPVIDIPMGNTEFEAYSNFKLAFENKLEKSAIPQDTEPKKQTTLKFTGGQK